MIGVLVCVGMLCCWVISQSRNQTGMILSDLSRYDYDVNRVEIILQNISNVTNNGTSTTNTTSIAFGTYQQVVVYLNIPFFVIFLSLFIFSIVSYFIQRKTVRRNQKILFAMLFIMSIGILLNMFSRIGSELAFLSPDVNIARIVNASVKSVDRVVVVFVIYIEVLVLSHICNIL